MAFRHLRLVRYFRPVHKPSITAVRLLSSSSSSPEPSPPSASASSDVLTQVHETHVTDDNVELHHDSNDAPQTDHPLFERQSRRRLLASPTLPLEAVSLSQPIQSALRKYVSALKMRPRHFTAAYAHFRQLRARETYRFVGQKVERVRGGRPKVTPPPKSYSSEQVAAYAANRFPGTFSSCVHVLSEVRRILPNDWKPKSVLDFGAGVGTGLLATTRAFTSPSISDHASLQLLREKRTTSQGEQVDDFLVLAGPENDDQVIANSSMPVNHAWLVDHSPEMINLAKQVLKQDMHISAHVKDIMMTPSLAEGPPKHRRYDLVIAPYSISEMISATMARPGVDNDGNPIQKRSKMDEQTAEQEADVSTKRKSLTPATRERVAEMRAKKLIRSLWRRTRPGGVLVVVEDGTAAGFETVLFARELLLSKNGRKRDNILDNKLRQLEEDELEGEEEKKRLKGLGEGDANSIEEEEEESSHMENVRARVIAPCIHSKKCPLEGSITRHRICRFVQRLNRPPLQRESFPKHNAFEDEYFSYIAIQKVQNNSEDENGDEENEDNLHGDQWGRLIRAPLRRSKHIAMDACTGDAKLERRVITKVNAARGYYPIARRTRWGDIWPMAPASACSDVNF